jgi:hypothetical protein
MKSPPGQFRACRAVRAVGAAVFALAAAAALASAAAAQAPNPDPATPEEALVTIFRRVCLDIGPEVGDPRRLARVFRWKPPGRAPRGPSCDGAVGPQIGAASYLADELGAPVLVTFGESLGGGTRSQTCAVEADGVDPGRTIDLYRREAGAGEGRASRAGGVARTSWPFAERGATYEVSAHDLGNAVAFTVCAR